MKKSNSINRFLVSSRFASLVKPKSFYETHAGGAESGTTRRCYFYNIDLQGRLFLEEHMPKNIATSIKDTRFLDFFYKRLQRVDDKMRIWMEANDVVPVTDYPFVSPCGRELNFVRPAATPVVFHSLMSSTAVQSDDANDHQQQLVFGGNMLEPFDEQKGIAISRVNGRLYHRLTTHSLDRRNKKATSTADGSQDEGGLPAAATPQHQYGLIRSSVAVTLSERIVPLDEQHEGRTHSGMGFETEQHGLVPIPWLPLEAEPGSWAMPTDAGDDE